MDSDIIPANRLSRKSLLRLADMALIPGIIVLVGLAAFGLGRLSALEEGRGTLIIHPPGDAQVIALPVDWGAANAASTSPVQIAHNFVASKNGSKYYLPTCAGASKISDANKIWFATAADAQAAGYTAAANCKGLQ